MANWNYKIELNKVMTKVSNDFDLSNYEEECPKEVKEAIAIEVEKAIPLKHFAPKLRKAVSIAEVNRIIERVYNEADRSLVWCGF